MFCSAEKCEGGDGFEWSAYIGGSAHLGPSAHQQSYCAPTGKNTATAFELYYMKRMALLLCSITQDTRWCNSLQVIDEI